MQAQFRPIAEVETTPVNGVIDIIGVVESVGDFMDITLKNGSATHKRSVQLKDQSNASVEVRLRPIFPKIAAEPMQRRALHVILQERRLQNNCCEFECVADQLHRQAICCCKIATAVVHQQGCVVRSSRCGA